MAKETWTTQDLYTTCCDTLEFDVNLTDDQGNPFTLAENDKLWYAVKHDHSDEEPPIYIEQHDTHFEIAGEPELLKAGIYLHEIGIIFANGKVKTVVKGKLYVENKIRGHTYDG